MHTGSQCDVLDDQKHYKYFYSISILNLLLFILFLYGRGDMLEGLFTHYSYGFKICQDVMRGGGEIGRVISDMGVLCV